MKRLTRSLPAVLLSIAAPASAHHSTAAFDLQNEVTLEGYVSKFEWANPHVYVHINTTNEGGQQVSWAVEAQPLAGMARVGWTPQSLAKGDHVIVVANPSKNPAGRIVLGQRILKDDGTRLEIPQLNKPPTQSSSDETHVAHSLSGVWVPRWNQDTASGFLAPRKAWSLTSGGIAAIDSYGPAVNPGKDCVPEPIPYRMIWPLPVTIEVGDVVTTIEFETGEKREVHMDRSSHDSAPYSYFGDSVASWDGDMLVVDTAHFKEHRRGNSPRGLASSRQKHLVERLELGDDRTYLNYEFLLEDPPYLAVPVTGRLELAYEPDFQFATSPCDLEVARRYLEE